MEKLVRPPVRPPIDLPSVLVSIHKKSIMKEYYGSLEMSKRKENLSRIKSARREVLREVYGRSYGRSYKLFHFTNP